MQKVTVDYVIGETTTRETITGDLVTINLSPTGRAVIQVYAATGGLIEAYMYREAHRIRRELQIK